MKPFLFVVTCIFSLPALAQTPFAHWNDSLLTLNNGLVQRTIQLPFHKGPFITTGYKPATGSFRYFDKNSEDFSFLLNNSLYSGWQQWQLSGIQAAKDSLQGNGASVQLMSSDGKVTLTVTYLLYPQLPVIRKSLTIKNNTSQSLSLESVDVEKFSVIPYYPLTFSWILSDYGRRKNIGSYEGNLQDALVMIHNPDWGEGIAIGNEAPGVLKRTAAFWNTPQITSGLTHKEDRFPFGKWLQPGESFTTPQVFTVVYNHQKNADVILNTVVPEFTRKHLGIRLSRFTEKPTFVYNTWMPFTKNINEALIMQLAKAAANAGMKEFVIDDGWQKDYGDWEIDSVKFPHGLKPVVDYIKLLGMKPGLWVSVGTATTNSKVYRQHPEWFIQDKSGHSASQVPGVTDQASACMSTGWYNHIKAVLHKLTADYGLEYLKLDFAVVTSAYKFDPAESGCYAKDHPGHQDHNESLYTNYAALWRLFDELHAEKPTLFIDCTFEAMGGMQLIDYAMLQHAEGNWLSNFDEGNESGDLRVRNMAWWRSPAVPATALVIGNLKMDDPGWENHIKALAGALPVLLGDPRKLSGDTLALYRSYAHWLQAMQVRYDYMSYRQDLPGFGEPAEGRWDGFQRINTKTKKGGIIGVFCSGATEKKRLVTIACLNAARRYAIKTMTGKTITVQTGKSLSDIGFEVTLTQLYDGALYEVSVLE